MRPYVNVVGKRFDRLLVQEDLGNNRVAVLCDCGTEKTVDRRAMRAGRIRSCGCLNSELSSKRFTKHGLSGSRIRSIWKGMHRRCNDPNSKGWRWYGGKGIKVCERWNSFETFYLDMHTTYTDELFIERKDSGKDYCPENCEWVTGEVQFKAKLTLDQVEEIKAATGGDSEVAEAYGVSRSYINMLRSGHRTRVHGS